MEGDSANQQAGDVTNGSTEAGLSLTGNAPSRIVSQQDPMISGQQPVSTTTDGSSIPDQLLNAVHSMNDHNEGGKQDGGATVPIMQPQMLMAPVAAGIPGFQQPGLLPSQIQTVNGQQMLLIPVAGPNGQQQLLTIPVSIPQSPGQQGQVAQIIALPTAGGQVLPTGGQMLTQAAVNGGVVASPGAQQAAHSGIAIHATAANEIASPTKSAPSPTTVTNQIIRTTSSRITGTSVMTNQIAGTQVVTSPSGQIQLIAGNTGLVNQATANATQILNRVQAAPPVTSQLVNGTHVLTNASPARQVLTSAIPQGVTTSAAMAAHLANQVVATQAAATNQTTATHHHVVTNQATGGQVLTNAAGQVLGTVVGTQILTPGVISPGVTVAASGGDELHSQASQQSISQLAAAADILGSTESTVDGINLEEIKEFARQFKIRRLSLGLTQTQVGQALSATEGPAYSQSAICRFEKLDITPKSAQKIKPVLERWMAEAEERYKNGAANLSEFIGQEPSKKRKRRTSFTPQALEVLNAHFEKNTHPSGAEMTALAEKLNYDREVIRVWFCNKRQALKNTIKKLKTHHEAVSAHHEAVVTQIAGPTHVTQIPQQVNLGSQQVSLGSQQVSLGSQVSLGPQVSLGSQVSLAQQVMNSQVTAHVTSPTITTDNLTAQDLTSGSLSP
ncbi:POU domain, class 6, transcription factor 2-like isoform X4 [Branchiostoma floridae]|uniref:POU domain protein n=1 Tax=Branchiostoma floridae TaxID=7739 RepID=A0A9J7LW40_BRAFL|nr:POU domain, class 6, transcription factor 2-like isoform X4 [Branchiostoma floridae]XP_035689311.1 POU domain, class 6, transcription factor 2-like isoform X4 [Branchiostoma floridae]